MPVVLYLITLVASSGVGIMSVRDVECELLWLACRRADKDGLDRSRPPRDAVFPPSVVSSLARLRPANCGDLSSSSSTLEWQEALGCYHLTVVAIAVESWS